MPKRYEASKELDKPGRLLYYRLRGWIRENADWTESDQLLTNQACMYEMRARSARAEIPTYVDDETLETRPKYMAIGSTGSPVVHPSVRVAESAEKAYVDCLRELGLTPKARAQFKVEPKPSGDDPFAGAFD